MLMHRAALGSLIALLQVVHSADGATLRVDFVMEFLSFDSPLNCTTDCIIEGRSTATFTLDTNITPFVREADATGTATTAHFEGAVLDGGFLDNPASGFGGDFEQQVSETSLWWFVGAFSAPGEPPGGRTLLALEFAPGPTDDAANIALDPSTYAFVVGRGDFLNFDGNRIVDASVRLVPEPSESFLSYVAVLGVALFRSRSDRRAGPSVMCRE